MMILRFETPQLLVESRQESDGVKDDCTTDLQAFAWLLIEVIKRLPIVRTELMLAHIVQELEFECDSFPKEVARFDRAARALIDAWDKHDKHDKEMAEFANPAMFDQLAKCLDESGVVHKPPPPAPESAP